MFRNVLIPMNLSERERLVVEMAAGLVESGAGFATLLHVIEEIEGLSGEEGDRFYSGLRQRAEKILEETIESLAPLRCELHRVVVVGKRASTIACFAEDEGCDLIVMGSQRLDPERPDKGIWTTSQKVSLLAGCPVLLVR